MIEISIVFPIIWYRLVDFKIRRNLNNSDNLTDSDKYLYNNILNKNSASIYLMSVFALITSVLYYIKCIEIVTNYLYLVPFGVFIIYFFLTLYFVNHRFSDFFNSDKLK